MSTSERTFNQVRAILSKLDRSIDEARERRTHPPAAAVPQAPAPQPATVQPAAPSPAPASNSQYGRAQPLNRGQPSGLSRWTN